jgi:hypothetical protein
MNNNSSLLIMQRTSKIPLLVMQQVVQALASLSSIFEEAQEP